MVPEERPLPNWLMVGSTVQDIWPTQVCVRFATSPLPWHAAFTLYGVAGHVPFEGAPWPPSACPNDANVMFVMMPLLGQLMVATDSASTSPHTATGAGGDDAAGDGFGGGSADGEVVGRVAPSHV